jgi:serine/threonine-protein kinase HipA
MSVTAYFRILPSRAKTILTEVEEAVAVWRDEGRALGMTAAELESFSDAFEHEERRVAQNAIA